MPKQIASSDRIARTVRSAPDLIEQIDAVALQRRSAFNEVANSFFEDGIRLAAVGVDVREILIEAGEIAARIMDARTGQPLAANARLLNVARVLRIAVSEAAARRLRPSAPMICMELWAGAIEIVEELGLSGEPWDILTSIRSSSPPLTDQQMRSVEAGINHHRATTATDHQRDRLEALAAYVAHAQHQHQEDWEDVKNQARKDLDEALGISKERGVE